jgi:phage baseplate assembly protein W
MSTTEKSLYKQITVKGGSKKDNVYIKSPTYKGFSTINDDIESSNTLYDIALIKQDIINHFHIRKGEKLSDPEFGTVIWDILFEPLTDQIKNLIIQDVSDIVNFDPRVSVNQIMVDSFENGIQVTCELVYLPYSITETLQFQFDESAGFLTE